MSKKRILVIVPPEYTDQDLERGQYKFEYRAFDRFLENPSQLEQAPNLAAVICPFYQLHNAQTLRILFQKPVLVINVTCNDEQKNQIEQDMTDFPDHTKFADQFYTINIRGETDISKIGDIAQDQMVKYLDDYFSK